MGEVHRVPGNAVCESERTAQTELGAVPRLITIPMPTAQRLEQVIGRAEKTAESELAPVGDRIKAVFSTHGKAAASDATMVRAGAEDRKVLEIHALPPTLEQAEAKVEVAFRCTKELLGLASRPELVERYFPGMRPGQLSEAQKQTAIGRAMLDMGYDAWEVRSLVRYSGLALSHLDENLAGARQMIKTGKRTDDPEAKAAISYMANSLASGALMDFEKYIIWQCGFAGYNTKGPGRAEALAKAEEGYAQLRDAETYVAYARMLALNNLVDESGKYVAKPNAALGKAYLTLVESGRDVEPGEYRRRAQDFHSFYANVASDAVQEHQRQTRINNAKGLEKMYILAEPYVDAAIPAAVAAIMIIEPTAIPFGSVYFGNEARKCFQQGDYVTGTLMTATLLVPAFAALRASSALSGLANGGMTLGIAAGITMQIDMAGKAVNILVGGVRQGEFTTSDVSALISIAGVVALPAAGMKAAGGIPGLRVALSKKHALEVLQNLALPSEWKKRTKENIETIEAGNPDLRATDLMKDAEAGARRWYDLFLDEAGRAGMKKEISEVCASAFLSVIYWSESIPYAKWGHNLRVAQYMKLLLDKGRISGDRGKLILAALTHDIGKLAVEGELLRKPGRLNHEEKRQVDEHTVASSVIALQIWKKYGLLEDADAVEIANAAACHHENMNGSGNFKYKGGDIPLGGRLIRILDSFDTMMGSRMYKRPMEIEYALNELENSVGSIYDPELTAIFTQTVRSSLAEVGRIMETGITKEDRKN